MVSNASDQVGPLPKLHGARGRWAEAEGDARPLERRQREPAVVAAAA